MAADPNIPNVDRVPQERVERAVKTTPRPISFLTAILVSIFSNR